MPSDIERLAARFEPATRRALLGAWETLRGKVTVGQIADAMRQGYEAVAQLLLTARLTPDELRLAAEPLASAMQTAATSSAFTFNLRFDLPDERAVGWVLSTADANGWLQVGVDRELIRSTVQRAFVEGGHPYQSAQALRYSVTMLPRDQLRLQRFAEGLWDSGVSEAMYNLRVDQFAARMLRDRARTIARTETIRAAQQGQLEGWRAAQAEGLLEPDRTWRVWSAVSDACDECQAMDGEIVKWDEAWPHGDMEAFLHPQCRCGQGLTFFDDVGKSAFAKPLGRYVDWGACVTDMTRRLGSKAAAERYCGKLQSLIEG